MTTDLQSGVYRGFVQHTRSAPTRHSFRYRLYMLYLDLAEIPQLFERRWLWSFERPNLYSFRRRDYLGDPATPLDESVRDVVYRHLGRRPGGPIRILTQLRSFGYVFNPVTFYYCFQDAAATELAAIVAEITNTPWGERHRYILRPGADTPMRFEFDKEFHISPFMDMDIDYAWHFSMPGDEIAVRMANTSGGDRLLDVTLQLQRHPWTGPQLAKTAILHPAMTTKVIAGIYWQALRLRLKGTPFFAHPKTLSSQT